MVNYGVFTFAGLVAALPLNINLGAYSPALVVGDGEISFGGRQDVAGLIGALEGAAVSAASGVAGAAAAPAVEAPAANVPAVESAAVDPVLAQQAQQIASLQGIAKEIAPRHHDEEDDTSAPAKSKRDLAGFDRALRYAEVGLVKGPDIQLGTGAHGSGVGIIVDNQPTKNEGARAERRDVDESSAPRRRAKVTTMYVRRGVPAAFQGSSEVPLAAAAPVAAPASPARRDVIDEVNLNVDGNAGLTMTFVEEVGEDDE
ncbi:hypothetical protein QBC34DRAFT_377318 [Podospora aff. communis PSN243]|uniref:Uncharacterized protein n=1 Tax=Podospora aff. communis PSN243 TaxID=3040156 RepID=A0AAV9GWK2_9PEZI|nr:hypothetical protein QBC34DRAFT_377318 [Podospora aff. communis PSN243]